jgi:hypothetical protein
MHYYRHLFVGLALLASVVPALHAATIYTAYQDPAVAGTQNYDLALGMDFDVVDAIQILALGTFDSGQDGIAGAITVAIYDRITQTAVPGLTLTIAGTEGSLAGGDRIVLLSTPIVLPAGFQGTIVATGYGNPADPNGNTCNSDNLPALDDGGGLIQFVGTSRYATVPGFPTVLDGAVARYAAGTFEYAATGVPEPGTLVTLCGAMLALVARRAFRSRG